MKVFILLTTFTLLFVVSKDSMGTCPPVYHSQTAGQCSMGGDTWPTVQNPNWNTVTSRVQPQGQVVSSSEIIDGKWVAVSTGGHVDSIQKEQNSSVYRFCLGTTPMKNNKRQKGRVEFSNCYSTDNDLLEDIVEKDFEAMKNNPSCLGGSSGPPDGSVVFFGGGGGCYNYNLAPAVNLTTKLKFRKTIKDVDSACKNVGTEREGWYKYDMYLPSSSATGKAIIAQWHGRADRRLYKTAFGALELLTYDESEYCQIGMDKFERGGYPPLSVKLQDQALSIKARSDARWFADSADKCRINSTEPTNCLNGDKESGLQQVRLLLPPGDIDVNALTDKWVRFVYHIKWSQYRNKQDGIANNDGFVKVWMNNDGQLTNVVDWTGPLGRNDEHLPYFKFGIYTPSGNENPFRIAYKDFAQGLQCTDVLNSSDCQSLQ